MEQDIRFCKTSDGVRIAYAVTGGGPPLVRSLGWFTHLEHEWETPYFGPFNQILSQHYTLVRYDGRGMGLSDRNTADFSLEAKVKDLEAVIDGAGIDRCAIMGLSEGGPTAVAYAVKHPDRVSRLVLYGSNPSFNQMAETSEGRQLADAMINLARVGWGSDHPSYRQFFTAMFMPDAPAEALRTFSQYQRASAPPESVVAMIEALIKFDVRDLAPQVSVPTLVIHRRGDTAVPFESGREFAALIPGARFLPLEGRNHIFMPDEPEAARFLQALDGFMAPDTAAAASPVATQSGLVTILFTDMEGSTALTQRLGDAKAQDILRQHNTVIRDALKAHGGSEIKHTGDGIMASFGSSSRALNCAVAIQQAFAPPDSSLPVRAETPYPVRVRIGLNAGEPVAEERDLFGTAVQLAARICARAEPGQVLAANVVRELAAGKGFLFSDHGDVALRGFEDPVRLYEVRWASETP
jgi:class 3 adenylate cyclase